MNRKSFIALFLALFFPQRKTPSKLTVSISMDDSKFREAVNRARAIAEKAGAQFHENTDTSRPHVLGFYCVERKA